MFLLLYSIHKKMFVNPETVPKDVSITYEWTVSCLEKTVTAGLLRCTQFVFQVHGMFLVR